MSPKTLHWVWVQLWEYSEIVWLHQQVFSYTDEISKLTRSIFVPYENKPWPSPFYWYKNGVFSTWDRIWWWWYEAELNRIHWRILPPASNTEWKLIWKTNIWIRKPRNISWDLSIPGLLQLTWDWQNWTFQFNDINHPDFSPKWWQLLSIDWKDNYGNILANIDWVQWLVTGEITSIMRVDNSE